MGHTTGLTGVTDADFETEVLHSALPVLVEFTAEWCPPCRQLAPVLADLARQEAGRLKVVTMDVDLNWATAGRHRVQAVPTMILFRHGEPVRSIVGARPKRRLLEDLADALPPAADALPPAAQPQVAG